MRVSCKFSPKNKPIRSALSETAEELRVFHGYGGTQKMRILCNFLKLISWKIPSRIWWCPRIGVPNRRMVISRKIPSFEMDENWGYPYMTKRKPPYVHVFGSCGEHANHIQPSTEQVLLLRLRRDTLLALGGSGCPLKMVARLKWVKPPN